MAHCMTDSITPPADLLDRGLVLVTGAGGFLGVNLVWALREQGLRVRALVRRAPPADVWNGLTDVELVRGDVRDAATMARVMTGVTHVIHSASLTEMTPRPRRRAFEVNVEGTRIVCAAAIRAGVRRLIYTSSLGTVSPGTAANPATEQTPFHNGLIRSVYHESKRRAERVVHAARELETITFCPAYIIGPRDYRLTTNQLLIYLALRPWLVMPPGGIPLIDVRETALAHVRALWMGIPGQRYILAGPYVSFPELGEIVQRVLGMTPRRHCLPRWTYGPGALLLALASGVLPRVPQYLSLSNFQFGFVPFHVSGALADRTFQLTHGPAIRSVWDTLRWFQDAGMAPCLTRPLIQTPLPSG